MIAPLRLFNSLTRQLEDFTPLTGNEARVYSCGPTVYNYPHIGNMRAYIFADTLGRVLRFKGYDLKHVINITDVGHLTDDADAGEDKMEKMAAEKRLSAREIADHYTQAYWADFRALNCREPAHWSIATDYVPRMIEFAKGIADKHCYELDGGLYFDTSTVPDYGRLARHGTDANDSLGGESRIDPVAGKRHAADFAIWRRTPPGETRQMEWESPWGRGAPGWHLECSVMSGELLGFPFDIHTGGIDHREIHHPNEIAQNQAHCGVADSGARIWMHNNFLIDRTGKMSKSSGEFLRLKTLTERGFHPLSYRLMCLQAHYRSELEFSWENLLAAQVRLKRMVMRVQALVENLGANSNIPAAYEAIEDATLARLLKAVEEQMSEDLNTASCLTFVDEIAQLNHGTSAEKLGAVVIADRMLGLDLIQLKRADLRLRPSNRAIPEPKIEDCLTERKAARTAKDFATSDRIRDELAAEGVEVMDGDPLGWDWKVVL